MTMESTSNGGAIILEDDTSDSENNSVEEEGQVNSKLGETSNNTHPSGSRIASGSTTEDNTGESTGPELLFCPSCKFKEEREEISWFPGDACPNCHQDYLSVE